MNLEQLQLAEQEAESAYRRADDAMRTAKRNELDAARSAIDEAHKDEEAHVDELSRAAWSARRAREEAEVAQAHLQVLHLQDGRELHVGDIITYAQKARYSWNPPRNLRGIVSVATHDTEYADNLSSWRLPKPGELYVHLFTKDGKLGKQIDLDYYGRKWVIETSAQSNSTEENKAS